MQAPSFKLRVARVLGKTGIARSILATKKHFQVPTGLTVLSYHRVAWPDPAEDTDRDVIDVSPHAFNEHLDVLASSCHVVTLDDVFAYSRGRRLPSNAVLLTFDDGYRDNHDVVLPLLQKHNLTATFFIATDFIENRRLFWWDYVALLINSSCKSTLTITYPYPMRLSLHPLKQHRGRAVRRVLRIIKDHRGLHLDRFIEHLSNITGVELSQSEHRRRANDLVMSWEHIQALRKAGMYIQSHTATHRVLQTLDEQCLKRELVASRQALEDVIGERVLAVSYPTGRPVGHSATLRDAVRDAGYELGFSNCSGVNASQAFDPLDTRRIAADAAPSAEHLKSVVAIPFFG